VRRGRKGEAFSVKGERGRGVEKEERYRIWEGLSGGRRRDWETVGRGNGWEGGGVDGREEGGERGKTKRECVGRGEVFRW
jgi:hypothetical protein